MYETYTYAGLWIDHKKTIIVVLTDGRVTVDHIESNIESRFRFSGGKGSAVPRSPQEVSFEPKRDARYQHHLHKYYQEVIHSLTDIDAVFIFGPGEAKGELEKEIKKSKHLAPKIKKIEDTDKMAENQIVIKVKKFFNISP